MVSQHPGSVSRLQQQFLFENLPKLKQSIIVYTREGKKVARAPTNTKPFIEHKLYFSHKGPMTKTFILSTRILHTLDHAVKTYSCSESTNVIRIVVMDIKQNLWRSLHSWLALPAVWLKHLGKSYPLTNMTWILGKCEMAWGDGSKETEKQRAVT